jgi:replicative DNA helicase
MNFPPPPQNVEAEQSVLGGVLLVDSVLQSFEHLGLKPHHFSRPSHAVIYKTMLDMAGDGKPIDFISLTERIKQDGRLNEIGGPAAIEMLLGPVPGLGNLEHYAHIVKEKAKWRERLAALYGGIDSIYAENEDQWVDAMVIADQAEADTRRRTTEVDVPDDFLDWYESPPGLPTPFAALTRAIGGGVVRGELCACAGWPRMGKTILSDQFVDTIAKEDARCHIFVNEMNTGVRTARMLARADAATWQRIRDRKLNSAEWGRVLKALPALPVQKYTKSHGWEVEEYCRAIRRNRWDFWVIDSTSRIPHRDTRELERVSGMLADVAGETGTVGMLVLQLNLERAKGLERPAPTSRDLLGGGMWYRDCRNIFFIHRKQEIIGDEGEEQAIPLAEGVVYDDKGTHSEPGSGRVAVKFKAERMSFEPTGRSAREQHPEDKMPF